MIRWALLIVVLLLANSAQAYAQEIHKFATTSRRGEEGKPLILKLDGTPRHYVEGGTLAAAKWTVVGVTKDAVAKGLQVRLSCTSAFQSALPLESVRGTFNVRHPSKERESDRIAFLIDGSKQSINLAIPRKLKGKSLGQRQELDLLDDLVNDETMVIEFRCLDRGGLIGFAKNDLVFVVAGAAKGNESNANAKPSDSEATKKTQQPFFAAIQACERTWTEFEAKTHTVNAGAPKKTSLILLADCNRLRNEVNATLRRLETEIDPAKPDGLAKKAAIQWMLGNRSVARSLVAKAAAQDAKMKCWDDYFQAKTLADNAELDRSTKKLLAALRGNPHPYIYVQCKKLYAQVAGEPLPADIRVPDGIERFSPNRKTLPWSSVPPILPELESLGRTVPPFSR